MGSASRCDSALSPALRASLVVLNGDRASCHEVPAAPAGTPGATEFTVASWTTGCRRNASSGKKHNKNSVQ
jgi:hypothetical protein